MLTSKQIRQQFLDFFRSKGHAIVPSSPVVPFDDPTLMFTNAGMNQFKDVFLGTGRREYVRAADTQKCIRAGGKHNDLDDVGQDTYHHTFFEMLGNWSFGDYFKEEAIRWAWELLTGVWGIDKTRLYATYFQGDPAEGLEPDSEAARLWREVTDIDPTHIVPGNKKDNFWEMGDTGPCGPCSEIHIDLTPDKSGGKLVNKGDARVMEIWNLVFIQYNRGQDGKLTPLPARHVDTGMGFERITAVLQSMDRAKSAAAGAAQRLPSNYDTDVFSPIFAAIQKRTGRPEYCGTLPGQDQRRDAEGAEESTSRLRDLSASAVHSVDQVMTDVSYRVIADHIRTLTFALTDGATPSNEGRGYVLRRILRRAVRYGRQYMNMHEPFLCDLVAPLVEHMGGVFPELRTGPDPKRPRENLKHVAEIIRDEEASFIKTLDRGIKLFSEAADVAQRHHHGKIRGEDAFRLHDTYGFPIDLTELMAEEQGLTIDIGEYERLMEEAREKARTGTRDLDDAFEEEAYKRLLSGKAATDDTLKYVPPYECEAMIWGIEFSHTHAGDGNVRAGESVVVSTNRTPFYAEQGGQVGDVGTITTETGEILVRKVIRRDFVIATRKTGHVVHQGTVTRGRINVEQNCRMRVDSVCRVPTMQHHTATHILNWALREVLGNHVDQKGSLVDPEKTRFDFSHPKPVADEELDRIEQLCREQIAAKLPVYAAVREEDFVDQKAAREINTLRAVFGEKYPDKVRVVSIGVPIGRVGDNDPTTLLGNPKDPRWMKYSVEFCGGTHVGNTKEIGQFVLTHEEGVAKGVRRVVGVAGDMAAKASALGDELLREAESLAGGTRQPAKSPDHQIDPAHLAALQQRLAAAVIPLRTRRRIQQVLADVQQRVKEQGKETAAASGEAVMEAVAGLLASAETVGGVTIVVGQVPPAGPDALRGAIDWVRNKTAASAVLLACVSSPVDKDGEVEPGKVVMVAGMSKAAVEKGLKAGDLIKEISPLVGGKGGGRPDMAQGGGPDAAGIAAAIEAGKTWIRGKLE